MNQASLICIDLFSNRSSLITDVSFSRIVTWALRRMFLVAIACSSQVGIQGTGENWNKLYCICLCCVATCFKACILGLVNGEVQACACISGTSCNHLTSSQPTFYPNCCYGNHLHECIIWQHLNSTLCVWLSDPESVWCYNMGSHQDLPMGRARSKRKTTSHGAAPDHGEMGVGEFIFCPPDRQFPGVTTQQRRRSQQDWALKARSMTNSTVHAGMAFPPSLFHSSRSPTPVPWDRFPK